LQELSNLWLEWDNTIMKQQLRQHKWILLILVLASGLRLIRLEQVPPSLYWEEAALGYDAYSILKTGKDYHGHSWPIIAFESFGDWKPALYFYLIVPLLPLLGLTSLAVRLPAAIAGISSVYLTYLIVQQLRLSKRVSLLSALALAIMPWHLQFSRAGFEVTVAVFWMLLGIWLILRSRANSRLIILAAVSLVLSMYTYHGLRILAPLAGSLTVVWWKSKFWQDRWIFISGLLAFGLLWPLIDNMHSIQVQQRIHETSLFSVSEAVASTNQWREEDGNTFLSRLIHHRYWYWTKEIMAGMMKHLEIDFLFISGDGNPRHQTGFFALLYYWMFIPLFAGWYWLFWKYKKIWIYLTSLILLATIPPALTKTTPHTLRFLPAAPLIAIFIGFGLNELGLWLRKFIQTKWIFAVLILAITLEWSIYSYDYFSVYPKRSSQEWQYGYRELMSYLQTQREHYATIYITRDVGRPSIYTLFYWQEDPLRVQKIEAEARQDQGELLEYGNIRFGDTDYLPGSLIVSTQPLSEFRLVNQFNYLNGKVAFWVYEN